MTVFADVPANTAPTVTIDILSQTVNGGETVNLAATGDDLEDDVLTYSWSGSGSFKDSSDPNTEWTAPAAQSTAQTYKLTLSVSDGDLSGSDFVNITVRANQCPSVTIDTSSRTVNGRSYVSLEATTSDPEGDSLSYTWSGSGTFSSPSSEDSVWRAPAAQTTEQTYALKLSVSDGRLTCSDSVDIIVRANQPPSVTITAPTAPIQPVNGGDTVSLKAIASDPEGDSLSYLWSATGNAGSFDNASSRNTDWTAPDAQPTNQAYTLTLTVSDTRLSKTATVDITVLGVVEPANTAPEVTILTPSQTVDVGETIDLAATGDDLEDDVLTYLWSASGNIGSFGDPSDPNTSWTAPQTVQSTLSTYTVELELTATDQGDLTDTHSITITINRPPTVTVSASSQDINVGDIVTLQATASDPDGNSLSYSWSTSPSSSGSFDDSAEKDTSWKGPETVQSTLSTYEVTLTLTVSDSRLTGSDSVTITINRPPTVTISTSPQTVDGGTDVTLQATASDPDGDTLSYSWSEENNAGSFDNSSSRNTDWTAPDAQPINQTYTLTLTVSDGRLSKTATVDITVLGVVEPANTEPTVTIDILSQTVDVGESINLVTTSDDPEDDVLTYLWSASGNIGSFGDPSAPNTSWTAPQTVQSTLTTYEVTLTVTATDPGGLEGSDSITITINRPPTVTITAPTALVQPVNVGDTVTLQATASDPDGNSLTYSWSTSPSSSGSFDDSAEKDTSWTAPETVQSTLSTYEVTLTLTVSDSRLRGSDSVTVTINRPPTVTISTSPQTVDGGTDVTLQATASDPDGDTLEYSWSEENNAGSFDDSDALNTTWTAPPAQTTNQTYILKLTVEDPDDLDAEDTVEITVRPPVNDPPSFVEGVSTSRSVPENSMPGTDVGLAVSANDSDSDTLTYSLSGTDAGLFAIDDQSGQITVGPGTVLNHEAPVNSYSVTAEVSDRKDADGNPDTVIDDTISVTITVTDVDEDGTVTLSPDSGEVGTEITASLEDEDIPVSNKSWRWERSTDGMAPWNSISGPESSTYTPTADDAGNFIRAVVTYTDLHGSGKTASQDVTVVPGKLSLALQLEDQTLVLGDELSMFVLPPAKDGTEPYKYSVKSSELPPGLSFNSVTRRISGEPTKKGSWEVSYIVTDSSEPPKMVDPTPKFTIQIVDALTAKDIPDERYYRGERSVSISLPFAMGGTPPYSYSVPAVSPPTQGPTNPVGPIEGLPAFLTFSETLLGITDNGAGASSNGEWEVSYIITDSSLEPITLEKKFRITVRNVPITIAPEVFLRHVDGKGPSDDKPWLDYNIKLTESLTKTWKVLTTYEVAFVEQGLFVEKLDFKLIVDKDTGIDAVGTCSFGSEADTDTGWRPGDKFFVLSRCRLGGDTSAKITMAGRLRPNLVTNQAIPSYTLSEEISVAEAPHYAGQEVTYYACRSVPTPTMLDEVDNFEDVMHAAAKDWTDRGLGFEFDKGSPSIASRCPGTAGSLYVFYKDREDLTEICGGEAALGCAKQVRDDSHLTRHVVYYLHPQEGVKYWVDEKSELKDSQGNLIADAYFLPAVLAHEFGHVIGLGHAKTTALMQGGHDRNNTDITNYDEDAVEALYEDHESHN